MVPHALPRESRHDPLTLQSPRALVWLEGGKGFHLGTNSDAAAEGGSVCVCVCVYECFPPTATVYVYEGAREPAATLSASSRKDAATRTQLRYVRILLRPSSPLIKKEDFTNAWKSLFFSYWKVSLVIYSTVWRESFLEPIRWFVYYFQWELGHDHIAHGLFPEKQHQSSLGEQLVGEERSGEEQQGFCPFGFSLRSFATGESSPDKDFENARGTGRTHFTPGIPPTSAVHPDQSHWGTLSCTMHVNSY